MRGMLILQGLMCIGVSMVSGLVQTFIHADPNYQPEAMIALQAVGWLCLAMAQMATRTRGSGQ